MRLKGEAALHESVASIGREAWDGCLAAPEYAANPFVSFVRDRLKMPVITWTIRDKPAVDLTFRYADQMTFEGFDPDKEFAGNVSA